MEFLCQELSLGAKDVTESSNSSVEGLTSSSLRSPRPDSDSEVGSNSSDNSGTDSLPEILPKNPCQ